MSVSVSEILSVIKDDIQGNKAPLIDNKVNSFRIDSRDMAGKGQIPGLTKASW